MSQHEIDNRVELPVARTLDVGGPLQAIWRRKLVVLLTLAATLGAAAAYVRFTRPQYTSTARVGIDSGAFKVSDTQQNSIARSSLQAQCEVLGSTPVLQQALRNCGRDRETFRGVDDPLAWLKRNLKIEPDRKSDVISISLESPDAQDAKVIVDSVVASFMYSSPSDSTAGGVLEALRRQKAARAAQLQKSLTALEQFRQSHGLLSLEEGNQGPLAKQLEELSSALTAAELEAIVAQAENDAAVAIKGDPARLRYFAQQNAGRAADPEQARIVAEINDLQQQLTVAKSQCSDEHPAVKALQARLDDARRRQAEADKAQVDGYLAAAGQRLATARAKQQEILRTLQKQRDKAMGIDSQASRLALLESDFKRNMRLDELLDSRINEMVLAAQTTPVMARVLDWASTPREPSSPNRAKVAAMAAGGGLMLGLLLAMAVGRLDRRVRCPQEIPAALRLPLLGTLPRITGGKSAIARGQAVLLDAASPAAEAVRDLRTALRFGLRDQRIKTMLIASALPREGKSTLVSNLAMSFAHAGQRTLVIDADLRRPVQHELLSQSLEPGLSEVISGAAKLDAAVQKTSIARLDLLAAGKTAEGAAEMLQSDAFSEMLKALSSRYDRILIDSPPLMLVTDARILGALCDATVLVVRAEKSDRRQSQQALEDLLDVGARIAGAVLTDVPTGNARYKGYGRYGVSGKKEYAARR